MARFVKFIGVHGEVAVNPERVLYAAPLPETGDCWLYFGGKGQADEGHPPVIVVQVKGALDEVVAALEGPGREAVTLTREDADKPRGDRPPLQAAAEDEPPLLPAPDHD